MKYDELQKHVDSRYVSAPEAMWRILGYKMHEQSHTIVRLPVHLPEEQNIVFNPEYLKNDADAVVENSQRDTMLTAWFKLNQSNEDAQSILYNDIPRHFVFNKKIKSGCYGNVVEIM